MIFVSHALAANEEGQPHLDRAAVWKGLVLKADNALPFVPAMTRCDIVERYGPASFDRDIEFRGQRFRERITLEEPHRVVFTRISGPSWARSPTRSRAPTTICGCASASRSSSPASRAAPRPSASTPRG